MHKAFRNSYAPFFPTGLHALSYTRHFSLWSKVW